MKLARVLLVSLVLLSIACVSGQPPVWSQVEDQDLCSTAGKWRYKTEAHIQALNELYDRKMVRAEYVGAVRNREIQIGMTECEVIAAWGWPTDQNKSHSSFGTRNQMVYRPYSSADAKYIYTNNSIVTSWQE